jgi:hypothetical protein
MYSDSLNFHKANIKFLAIIDDLYLINDWLYLNKNIRMKIGKIPVASIMLIVIALVRITMNRFYPGQYTSESPFVTGMFFGGLLIFLLYYVNIFYIALMKIKSRKDDELTGLSFYNNIIFWFRASLSVLQSRFFLCPLDETKIADKAK